MTDLDLPGGQHLAEDVRERQPEVLHVVAADQPGRRDGLRHVRPVVLRQPHALGAAGRARGVDQRGQLVGGDGRDPLLDRVRVLLQIRGAARLQLGEGEHPALGVALDRLGARRVEDHDVLEVRQLGAALARLRQLGRVLREEHPALGVAQDVRRLLGVGLRVNGGGRAARAHHTEVREDPLDAGGGGERHALLGGDAQIGEPGRDRVDPVGGLPPAQRLPLLKALAVGGRDRMAIGLQVRGGLHPLDEEGRHGRWPVLDQGLCVAHDVLRAGLRQGCGCFLFNWRVTIGP